VKRKMKDEVRRAYKVEKEHLRQGKKGSDNEWIAPNGNDPAPSGKA
jgi:hypothetical protein